MKIIEVYEKSPDKYSKGILHKVFVDDEDYDELKKWNWIWRDGYACRKLGHTYYQMHRQIMGVAFKEKILVDHEDRDHHNNQKDNLRRADRFQNQQNRSTNKDNTLPKGIQQLPSGRYRVRVQGWNKRVTVGTYDTIEEAMNARNDYAEQWHGEFFSPSHVV